MNTQPKPNALSWLWLTAAVIALDQLTKAWVLAAIRPGEQVPVISGFWYWTLAFNKGAAFSFLADGSGCSSVPVSACGWRARRAATGAPRCRWR
jgi:signal peptidase II